MIDNEAPKYTSNKLNMTLRVKNVKYKYNFEIMHYAYLKSQYYQIWFMFILKI